MSLGPTRGIKTYYLWQPVSQWELKHEHKALWAAEGRRKGERESDKRKGEGKERGAVGFILPVRKTHLLVGWTVTAFDRLWFDELDLDARCGHAAFSDLGFVFPTRSEVILSKWYTQPPQISSKLQTIHKKKKKNPTVPGESSTIVSRNYSTIPTLWY